MDKRVEEVVRRLHDKSTNYHDDACCGAQLLADLSAAVRAGLELAIEAARKAKLPKHYQWGRDAMEQFGVGKERAVAAIRALAKESTP